MAVRNIKSRKGTIFIPTDTDIYCKIIITDDSDVNYTLMNTYSGLDADNEMVSAPTVKMSATDALGSFKFTIANDGGRFLNKFNGGELVKVYADDTDATTLIFAGKVDNVKYGLSLSLGFFIEITGRDYPELIDKTITGVEAATQSDVSIARILYDFYGLDTNIKLQYWEDDYWWTATYDSAEEKLRWGWPVEPDYPSTLINMTYQHKKGWNVITEICSRAGLDCYIDYDESNSIFILKLFKKEAIVNTDSNVAYGINLTKMTTFGSDNNSIINRVIVYGKTDSDNILLLKTENDTTSQDNLWVKDKVFNEGALTSMLDVQDKANYELEEGIKESSNGKISTLCLPTLRPGDVITISVPYCNVSGQYVVSNFTHTFGDTVKTDIELTKREVRIGDLFSEKADPEDYISSISNPNAMTDSYTVYFDETPSIMNLTDAEEYDGKLRIGGTNTEGTAISTSKTTDYNVTSCELRKYENFETTLDAYYVTNNSGVTWETYDHEPGFPHTFTSVGDSLGFKIVLNRDSGTATSPSYESVSLLYK